MLKRSSFDSEKKLAQVLIESIFPGVKQMLEVL